MGETITLNEFMWVKCEVTSLGTCSPEAAFILEEKSETSFSITTQYLPPFPEAHRAAGISRPMPGLLLSEYLGCHLT